MITSSGYPVPSYFEFAVVLTFGTTFITQLVTFIRTLIFERQVLMYYIFYQDRAEKIVLKSLFAPEWVSMLYRKVLPKKWHSFFTKLLVLCTFSKWCFRIEQKTWVDCNGCSNWILSYYLFLSDSVLDAQSEKKGPLTIVDFGAADGGSTIDIIHEMIGKNKCDVINTTYFCTCVLSFIIDVK